MIPASLLPPAQLVPAPKVRAVMSVPRLGFMDMFFCALGILPKFGIEVSKTTGAFWGQCMERGMEQAIAEGCDYVLTLDYDSVFTERHLEQLLALAVHYNLDAVAPIQIGRRSEMPLFRLRASGADGEWMREVSRDTFSSDLVRAGSAHFGLTLIKASKLASLPKPWFIGQPDECGRWGEGRIDDDVNFWRGWEAAGNTLHIASRVAIGHAELKVLWPDVNLEALHQHPSEFWERRSAPEGAWT